VQGAIRTPDADDPPQGHDFPEDLTPYRLAVHCGACMWNRAEMLARIDHCKRSGVPIMNYGVSIAYLLGVFERARAPFPSALEIYREAVGSQAANRVGSEGITDGRPA